LVRGAAVAKARRSKSFLLLFFKKEALFSSLVFIGLWALIAAYPLAEAVRGV
jgi:hypothetical protein